MKILAIVDDRHTCDCCGKTPIKRAAAVELEDGTIQYYGMVCATKKHFGKKESELQADIRKLRAAEVSRVRAFIAPRHELKEKKHAFDEARRLYRFGPKFAAHVRPSSEAVSKLVADILGDNPSKIRESEVI